MDDPDNIVYLVDKDTCGIRPMPANAVSSLHRHYPTRQAAALLAFHLATEKQAHWVTVKDNLWQEYCKERDAVKP